MGGKETTNGDNVNTNHQEKKLNNMQEDNSNKKDESMSFLDWLLENVNNVKYNITHPQEFANSMINGAADIPRTLWREVKKGAGFFAEGVQGMAGVIKNDFATIGNFFSSNTATKETSNMTQKEQRQQDNQQKTENRQTAKPPQTIAK